VLTALKKIRNAIVWVAAYEVWRFNAKITYQIIGRVRDAKTDEMTWKMAVGEALETAKEEARNGTR
jgi:hypothetical protein